MVGAPDGILQWKTIVSAIKRKVGLARIIVVEVGRVAGLQSREALVRKCYPRIPTPAFPSVTLVSSAKKALSAALPTPWLIPIVLLVRLQN